MTIVERFVVRHELATHRRWLANIYADWHLMETNEKKADLARRLVSRLRTIAELEERQR